MEVRPGYTQTEYGLLPVDWVVIRLDALCDVRDGTHESPKYHRRGVPFVTSKNIVEGSLDLETVTYISEEDAININKRSKVERDDILMSMIGTIGNSVLVDFEPDFCIKNVALIKPERIDPRYLIQLLQSPPFRKYLNDNLEGGIQRFVSLGTLRGLHVPVPTRFEQRAIATVLSDVDALITSLDTLIAKKRDIKQGAMQQLLTGKTRLPGFSREWRTEQLGSFASIRNLKVLPSNVDPDTLCVKLEHIGQGDGRLLGRSKARHSTSSKYRFREGDVLFGRLRSYLRKFWHADQDGICTTEIWPLTVDSEWACSGFLFATVQTDRFIEAASISYGTHMPRADWGVIQELEVHLPQLDEQHAIAAILSDMDAEIAALERRRDKTRALKQGMMQELLTGRIRLV